MRLTLGIDTGGTCTDAVIVESASRQVLSQAKALTTPDDLSLGIANAIDGLGTVETARLGMVSISTTLATNAIVEGRGGRVALLLIGYDEELIQRSGLDKRLPVETLDYITGGHDVKGEETRPLDEQAARQAVLRFRGRAEACAISGYFSVMNPEHELRLKALVRELTPIPVVCGHELTSKLNALKRVSTVVLNARLLPMIQHLLDSVKRVLEDKGITAPLMVLKGDGSLISEALARQRPVETILSGPAASAIGAEFLSGENNAIVIDMGGTTTDLAVLKNGQPWNNPSGATVGGWQTCVQAADLRTIGMGGDSHIHVARDGAISIGPARAIPLCRLGAAHPNILRELELAAGSDLAHSAVPPGEFITAAQAPHGSSLGSAQQGLIESLRQGPLSLTRLEGMPAGTLALVENLEKLGLVRRAALTPTDILWPGAPEIGGCHAAARAGLQLAAHRAGISPEALAQQVVETMVDTVVHTILDKLVSDATGHTLFPAPRPWSALLARLLGHETIPGLGGELRLSSPIIAIGAPVASFIPRAAEKLHTRWFIPPHAGVGNAVGAAAACITHTVEILVQPHVQGSGTLTYLVHSPSGREVLDSFAAAVAHAEILAAKTARQAALDAGAVEITLKIDQQSIQMGTLCEVTVRACASGRPQGKSEGDFNG